MTRLPGTGKGTGTSTPLPERGPGFTTSIRPLFAAGPARAEAQSGAEFVPEPGTSGGPVSGRRMTYSPGLIIAEKYELLRPLGAGGMGEVWVAHHLNLDIDVAIKFIGDIQARESGLAERLLEEAQNTARLGHPAIVRALDFGHTVRGEPFIVLELLAGVDLATHIEQGGALAPERAVATLLPIVHALGAVHESGIVHRDIKPENVFFAEVELGIQAKLLDFGIARKTDRAQRLTVRDVALGTPDYMSPEQARGETSDASTDQWSFCVVLFEAITRARPFAGENYNALLRAIIDDEPKTLFEFGVDQPELWQILARGLAKTPSGRFESMRELGEALARWLLSRGVTEDSVGTSLRRAWLKEVNLRSSSDEVNVREPDLAALGRAPTQAQAARASDAQHEAVLVALEEALSPPGEHYSVPDLQALAELHRGGDPEDRLRRDAQRRTIVSLVVLVSLVLGTTFAILFGTGVIAW